MYDVQQQDLPLRPSATRASLLKIFLFSALLAISFLIGLKSYKIKKSYLDSPKPGHPYKGSK
jgi:hypothetical protein